MRYRCVFECISFFVYTNIKFSFNIIANKQSMQSKCTFDHLNFFLRTFVVLGNQDGFSRLIKWSRETLKRIRFAHFYGHKCIECFMKHIIRWSTLWQLNRLSNDPVDCTFTAFLSLYLLRIPIWKFDPFRIGNSIRIFAPRTFVVSLLIHAYIFSLQAILFYTPRWLWKSWEGGKIHALMLDLDIGICSEIEKRQKKKLLLDYLWDNLRWDQIKSVKKDMELLMPIIPFGLQIPQLVGVSILRVRTAGVIKCNR